ncbi:MAG: hypothetical protein R3286_16310, partial [Gammaproteobacteria bacterium]|nr:hypothetical protein [Gammaproteobacteria bacterium]
MPFNSVARMSTPCTRALRPPSRSLRAGAGVLLALCLALAPGARADQVTNLYEAEVQVGGKSVEERDTALAAALA